MHTVVSAMPFGINEFKPGLAPPKYVIPPAEEGNVQVLHVERAPYGVYVGDGRSLVQTDDSEIVANSIVNDFVSAQLVHESGAKPALFVLEGKVSAEDVKHRHKPALDSALAMQKVWFWKLVQLADDDWQKYRQHKMITDIQKFAAKALGLKKDWLYSVTDTQSCPGCGSTVLANIAICPNCRAVLDSDKAKTLQFASAK